MNCSIATILSTTVQERKQWEARQVLSNVFPGILQEMRGGVKEKKGEPAARKKEGGELVNVYVVEACT